MEPSSDGAKQFGSLDEARRALKKIADRLPSLLGDLKTLQRLYSLACTTFPEFHKHVRRSALAVKTFDVQGPGKRWGQNAPTPGKVPTQLLTRFKHLQELEDSYDSATAIVNSLTHDIKIADSEGQRAHKQTLENAKTLQRIIKQELVNTYNALHQAAKKVLPPHLRRLVTAIRNHLADKLKGRYSKLEDTVSIQPVGNALHFIYYLAFTNLKDDDNYVWPEFYVVLTLVVQQDGDEILYVNTLPKRLPPGRYTLHQKVAVEHHQNINDPEKITKKTVDHAIDDYSKTKDLIGLLMAKQKFADVISPRPIPLKKSQISFKSDLVTQIAIKDRILKVWLKKEVTRSDQAKVIANDLVLELKALVQKSHPRNKQAIRWKIMRRQGGTQYGIFFRFSPSPGAVGVTPSPYAIQQLMQNLHITQQQALRLVDLLEEVPTKPNPGAHPAPQLFKHPMIEKKK